LPQPHLGSGIGETLRADLFLNRVQVMEYLVIGIRIMLAVKFKTSMRKVITTLSINEQSHQFFDPCIVISV